MAMRGIQCFERRWIDGFLQKRFDIAMRLNGLDLQHDAFQRRALNFRHRLRFLHMSFDVARVEPEALTRHRTSCTTRALLASRTRCPLLQQTRHARLGIILRLANTTGIDDKADFRDRDRCFCHVRRYNDFAFVFLHALEHAALFMRSEVRMQG